MKYTKTIRQDCISYPRRQSSRNNLYPNNSFLNIQDTSINAFSEDFFVHTDTYTTLKEKLSQNGNKEGTEKSMEYQTWRVQGFYPWNKTEELKKLAS